MYTTIISDNDMFLLYQDEFDKALTNFFGKDNPINIEEFEKESGAVFNIESDYKITSHDIRNHIYHITLAIVTDNNKWRKSVKKYKFTDAYYPHDRYRPIGYNKHKEFLEVFDSLPKKRNNRTLRNVRKLFTQIEEHWNSRNPRIHFEYFKKYGECSPFKKTKKYVIMSKTEFSKRIGKGFFSFTGNKKDNKLINSWGLLNPELDYISKNSIGYKFKILSEQKLMLHMLNH